MARNTDSQTQPPEADLKTVIVRPDDVVNAMRRNHRDQDEQRTHTLRVTPPFKGDQEAELYVSQNHTHYPPDMDPKPLHLSPDDILSGYAPHGAVHPDFPDVLRHPCRSTERRLYREEVPEDEQSPERWEEWWNTVLDVWESNLRHALEDPKDVTIVSPDPSVANTSVEVVFKSE